ncbi:ABC transporter permease [Alicyclobacillus macrosporangiidus]|jgi:ABC-2 type transport system permease protein|uniref:ABC-type Na+ efflux pump, permease component n=1 Tax=Alicyclobacillus macrosporangiidus TaxID=392015 RepID=A0A1I7JJ33_9BACL|nr:ABC transporter permease [Alicyclobacillus macrosporangiidus]SFU85204.1 ABC-type Na+ efflux pump, permease component [Alicyclobacillus macrosporangiidus]
MNGLWIMVEREFMARVTRKAYWFMTLFGLAVMVALTFMPTIMQWIQHSTQKRIAVADPNRLLAASTVPPQSDASDFTLDILPVDVARRITGSDEALTSYFHDSKVSAVVVVRGAQTADATFVIEENDTLEPSTLQQVEGWARQQVMSARVQQLGPAAQTALSRPVPVDVHARNPNSFSFEQRLQSTMLVYAMVILLFTTVIAYGAWVVQGVIEEKSNRIIEMMLIALKPWQILFGKVIGIALVALVQYALWTAGVLVARAIRGSAAAIPVEHVSPATLALFPLFFLLGYLMYATLFSIGGSLVHRAEEQQLAVTPVTLLLVVVFYASLLAVFKPDSTWATIISFIPPCMPIAMFARVALTHVPVWQLILSIAGGLVVIWLLVWAGAVVYRRFALHTSGASGWKLLLRGGHGG